MAMPLRPRPDDFRAMFIQHGWDAGEHYGAHWTVMRRWVDEEGRADLLAARAAQVRANTQAAMAARRRRRMLGCDPASDRAHAADERARKLGTGSAPHQHHLERLRA